MVTGGNSNFLQKTENALKHAQICTFRDRVRSAVERSPRPLSGQEVARAVGAPYKPSIDALQALHNQGKVDRIGRKFTAKWFCPSKPDHGHVQGLIDLWAAKKV